MKESQKKAFDFASESTKLLITLSTGIIALTITFSKDFIGDTSVIPIWPLIVAWVLFFLSIVFGVFTMLSMTGTLLPKGIDFSRIDEHENKLSINEGNITFKALVQIVLFLLALIFTCVFGYKSLSATPEVEKKEKTEIKRGAIGLENIKKSLPTLGMARF